METLTALQSLSNQALAMAHSSIKLIGELDEPAFIRLMAHEETIENLTQKLIDISQQHKGKEASQLLAITKNLERIGDLALDIGRSCHYIHTGQKYEKSEPLALTQ